MRLVSKIIARRGFIRGLLGGAIAVGTAGAKSVSDAVSPPVVPDAPETNTKDKFSDFVSAVEAVGDIRYSPARLTKVELEAISIPAVVTIAETSGYSAPGIGAGIYRRVDAEPAHLGALRSQDRYLSDGTPNEINGGWWEILPGHDGVVSAEAFGLVVGDRAAASSNGAALQDAVDFAIEHDCALYLGAGNFFLDTGILQDGPATIYGAGVQSWSKFNTIFQGVAKTQLVMTGTGAKHQKIWGVSSMYNWGAGRINPSARAGYNDKEYRLLSFVEKSTSASGRSLKPFSCAWTQTRNASGSTLRDFRIIPDYGGTDGMDGYTNEYRRTVGIITYPLSDGVWDVGLWQNRTVGVVAERFHVVGQWRMAGLLATAHSKTPPAGYYHNTFRDCEFSGYHGVEIRAFDGAPVVASTATSVDIPWADDHPFGADGDMSIRFSSGSWPKDVEYTFTTMTKETRGSYDILRISGISPKVPAKTKSAFPYAKGGGTSHTNFIGGCIQGFHHPSREQCHVKNLGGIKGGAFQYPGGCVFISGTKVTEIDMRQVSLTGQEEIAVHIHDCRNFSFDGYVEMNKGGRVIMSPSRHDNPHSLAGFAAAGTLYPIWIHRGSTINNGSLDTRPSLPYINMPRFNDPADNGFMEAVYLHAPLDPGMTSSLSPGAALVAAPGGRVGIGKRTRKPPFNPNPAKHPFKDEIDYAFSYDYEDDFVRVRKPIRSNTAGQADLGSFGAGAFGAMIGERFASYNLKGVADDTVAEVACPVSNGLAIIIVTGHSIFSGGSGGLLFYEVGANLGAAMWAGSSNFTVINAKPSGTTGTDGNITVGIKTGSIVIENRRGGTIDATVTFLG